MRRIAIAIAAISLTAVACRPSAPDAPDAKDANATTSASASATGNGAQPATSSPFRAVATREGPIAIYVLDGTLFVSASTAFYQVAPTGLTRVLEMSRGAPRSALRGYPPDVGALGGRWPDATFAQWSARAAGGSGTVVPSVYQWDEGQRAWKVARAKLAGNDANGLYYYSAFASYRDGGVLGLVGYEPYASSGTDLDALLGKRAPFEVVSGSPLLPATDAGFCVDDIAGPFGSDLLAVGHKCGETGAVVLQWSAQAKPRTTSPFAGGAPPAATSVAPRLAGSSANDVYAFTDTQLAHYDGTTWTATPLPAFGALWSLEATSDGTLWALGESKEQGASLFRRARAASWEKVALPDPPSKATPFYWTQLLAVDANDAWLVATTDQRERSGSVIFHTTAPATPAVAILTRAELDAEAADRDPPESATSACSGQTFSIVRDAGKAAFDFADLATLVKAQPELAGTFEEVLWLGQRYVGIEDDQGGKDAAAADARAKKLRVAKALRYCRFYPKVLRTVSIDKSGSVKDAANGAR